MAVRQPSIGIRRISSSQGLREQAAASASTQNLQQTSSRLPALDETCALENAQLGQTQSNTSTSSSSTTQQEQPSRLRRASLAVQSKLGLRKDKEKDVEAGNEPTGTAVPMAPADQSREYAPSMVDVLDTVGMQNP